MSNKYDTVLGDYRQSDFTTAIGDARYIKLNQTTPQTVSGDLTITGDFSGDNLSGTNTGDQDLSGLLPKSGGAMTGVLTYASPQVLNMQPVDAEPDAVDMVEGCIYFVVEDV